jgi:basic membrane protein A
MMKRFSRIMKAAGAMVLALSMMTACGTKTSTTTTTAANSTSGRGKIAYIVGNLGDKSFSDSGEEGMKTLRAEGWEAKTVETGDSSKADKYEDYIRDTLDEGYTYLVASSTYGDIFVKIASEYPGARFLIFDDNRDESELPSNVSCIFYAQNEGSYLVGLMAAAMSKTGTVAVNVGIENPVINDFVTGFIQGAKDYDPNCSVIEAAVGSWSDPVTMKSLCLDQVRNNKADVFFNVAGGSGDGLFEACVESGTWAIGVDSDQYAYYAESENPEKAGVILTSMLKEVGNSFVSFFHSVEAGEDVWGKTLTLGLSADAVGYVDNDFFAANVPEDVRTAMAEVSTKVKSGELTIKSYYDFASEAEFIAYRDAAK